MMETRRLLAVISLFVMLLPLTASGEEGTNADWLRKITNCQMPVDGTMVIEVDGKYGYIDISTGRGLSEPQWEEAYSFSEGLVPVVREERLCTLKMALPTRERPQRKFGFAL